MAKRFVDSELWDKEWYVSLSLKNKCLVRFLFDKCDAAGVWSANFSLASYYIGEKITEADLENLSGVVRKIAEKKFFVIGFIEFQYGNLSPACKPHLKILGLLDKHKINSKGYPKGIETLEEEDKEKEEEKENTREEIILLVPKMYLEWKEAQPGYVADKAKDSPALLGIAKSIADKLKIRFNPGDPLCIDAILHEWKHLCEHIPKDNFYMNYSLQQVSKYLQSIYLKIENGSNKTSNKNTGVGKTITFDRA